VVGQAWAVVAPTDWDNVPRIYAGPGVEYGYAVLGSGGTFWCTLEFPCLATDVFQVLELRTDWVYAVFDLGAGTYLYGWVERAKLAFQSDALVYPTPYHVPYDDDPAVLTWVEPGNPNVCKGSAAIGPAAGLNLRTAPDKNSESQLVVPQAELVGIYWCERQPSQDGHVSVGDMTILSEWTFVRYGTHLGWVTSKYLSAVYSEYGQA
jgi:hypothetical protein